MISASEGWSCRFQLPEQPPDVCGFQSLTTAPYRLPARTTELPFQNCATPALKLNAGRAVSPGAASLRARAAIVFDRCQKGPTPGCGWQPLHRLHRALGPASRATPIRVIAPLHQAPSTRAPLAPPAPLETGGGNCDRAPPLRLCPLFSSNSARSLHCGLAADACFTAAKKLIKFEGLPRHATCSWSSRSGCCHLRLPIPPRARRHHRQHPHPPRTNDLEAV